MEEYVLTLIMYFIIGCITCLFISSEKMVGFTFREVKIQFDLGRFIFIGILAFFAAYRYVGYVNGDPTGGSDAPAYIDFYYNCLDVDNKSFYTNASEPLFQYGTKFIRYFTNDHHIYFLIVYGFIASAYYSFVRHFRVEPLYRILFVMLIVPFVGSFCVMRTHITIAISLYQIILLHKGKIILPLLFAILGVGIQVSSGIVLLFPFFYWYFRDKNLTSRKVIKWTLLGIVLGKVAQSIVLGMNINNKYLIYASRSINNPDYWLDYSKLIFDQVIVLIIIMITAKLILKCAKECSTDEYRKMQYLMLVLYYDFMLVPVCGILGIWREANYFYIVRLFMLSFLINHVIRRRENREFFIYIILTISVIIWFLVSFIRLQNGGSHVIPYYFEPFMSIT